MTEAGIKKSKGVVITTPAAFNQMQSEDTIAAARLAGLEKVSLLQEPVAAALAAIAHSKQKDGSSWSTTLEAELLTWLWS